MATMTAVKSIRYVGLACIGLGSALLASTNPNQLAYGKFATQQTVNLLLRDVCKANQQPSEFLEKVWGNSCETLSTNGASEIEKFVTHNTQRQNLFLCSLYTTELPLHSLKVLGISNHFVVISFDASESFNVGFTLPENRPVTARPLNDR